MNSRKTKAELQAELRACKRENEILRDNLAMVLDLNDAYLKDRNIIDAAHSETINRLIPLADDSTTLKYKTAKHSQDAARGGKGYEPLAEHKAALLKLYKDEQQASKKHPNKTKLTEKYIAEHPGLVDSFDALRKSLPKRKK